MRLGVSSGGAILCLHSLTTKALPSEGLANLPLEQFGTFVQVLRRVSTLVPLTELLDSHQSGRRTTGLVAVTFDDAYASLLEACSLLESERIPATVFVTTRATRTGARFWWDRLDDLAARTEPDRWRRFEDALGLPEEYRRGQPPRLGALRPLRQWLLAAHRGRWPDALENLLGQLEHEVGFQTAHRPMNFEELTLLAQNPLVDFGVHTVTHPVLPLLRDAEFIDEVAGCCRELQRQLPRVQPILAIPFGLFDRRTAMLAREAGMSASLSLAARTLRGFRPDSPLPRFCLTSREQSWKLQLRVTGLAELLLGWRMEGGRGFPALPSPTS